VAAGFSKHGDDELVLLCRKGREGAFLELYNRYKQRLINYAWRMLRDRDAAADVLQETFQYFFRKIPEYRAEGKLAILLYRVARNLCLNKLKQSRTRKELPLEEAAVVSEDCAESSKALQEQEVRRYVTEALEKLPAIYSEIIILRILKNVPVSEVARIVECPEGTVKSRLHNGLEFLRKLLRESDFR
jgi:RNA polymerase sigma-70 factor (ECF subfamily)